MCCGYLWVLGMRARVCVAHLPDLRAVAPVGRVVMLMSVLGCAWGVRWGGAMLFQHGRGVMCFGIECGRCMLEGLECSELTRAFAASHVCDCGVVRRLMVLGGKRQRAGARAFCGEGPRGERDEGWLGL